MTRSLAVPLVLLVFQSSCVAQSTADADEAILRGAKITADGPGLVAYFQNRSVNSQEDQKKIEELIKKLGSQRFRDREQAAEELIALGKSARAALVVATMAKDLELRIRAEKCLAVIDAAKNIEVELAALRLLRLRNPDQACSVLLAYFPSIHDGQIEEEALTTLAAVSFPKGKAATVLSVNLKEKNPVRRGVAAMLLGWKGSETERAAVYQMLMKEPDSLVRLRIVQGLVAAKHRKALAQLLPLLTDASLPIAEQARDLLALAGGKTSVVTKLGTDSASRKKCREEWEQWWDAHGERVDLATAGIDVPWYNIDVRARATVLRWIECMNNGDLNEVHKVTAMPFAIADQAVLKTQKEFDELLGQAAKNEPREKLIVSSLKVQRVEDVAKKLKRTAFDLLAKYPHNEIRVVSITGKGDAQAPQVSLMMFVHVRGGEGRVFGFGIEEKPSD